MKKRTKDSILVEKKILRISFVVQRVFITWEREQLIRVGM
jgi:hypothetical protein